MGAAVDVYELAHSIGFDVLLQDLGDERLGLKGMNLPARSYELRKRTVICPFASTTTLVRSVPPWQLDTDQESAHQVLMYRMF
jgi:hypothetical protein